MEVHGHVESVDGDLAIRIPAEFAEFLGYKDGRKVRLTIEETRLVISTRRERRYTLEETPESKHGREPPSRGRLGSAGRE